MSDAAVTSAPAAPAAQPAALVTSAPAAPVELSALGANVPPSGAERATWVMAGALVDAGVLTLEQARAQLASRSEPATQPAQDPGSTPHGQPTGQPTGIDPEIAAGLNSTNESARAAAAVKASQQVAGALQNMGEDSVPAGIAKWYGDKLRQGLANPPTEAVNAERAQATKAHLVAMHGQQGAEKLIADAKAELNRLDHLRPGLKALVLHSGDGNHPSLISELARMHNQRAQRELAKGLKR